MSFSHRTLPSRGLGFSKGTTFARGFPLFGDNQSLARRCHLGEEQPAIGFELPDSHGTRVA